MGEIVIKINKIMRVGEDTGEENEFYRVPHTPATKVCFQNNYDVLPEPALPKKTLSTRDSDFVFKLRKFMKQEFYTQIDLAKQVNCSQAKVSTFLCLRMSDRAHGRMVALIRDWMARTDHSSLRHDRATKTQESQMAQRRHQKTKEEGEGEEDKEHTEQNRKREREREGEKGEAYGGYTTTTTTTTNDEGISTIESHKGHVWGGTRDPDSPTSDATIIDETLPKPKRKKGVRRPRHVIEAVLRAPPPEIDFTPLEFKERTKRVAPSTRYVRKLQSDLATALSTPTAKQSHYEMMSANDREVYSRRMTGGTHLAFGKRKSTIDLFCNEGPDCLNEGRRGTGTGFRSRIRLGPSPYSSAFAPLSTIFSGHPTDTIITQSQQVDNDMELAARGLLGLCQYSHYCHTTTTTSPRAGQSRPPTVLDPPIAPTASTSTTSANTIIASHSHISDSSGEPSTSGSGDQFNEGGDSYSSEIDDDIVLSVPRISAQAWHECEKNELSTCKISINTTSNTNNNTNNNNNTNSCGNDNDNDHSSSHSNNKNNNNTNVIVHTNLGVKKMSPHTHVYQEPLVMHTYVNEEDSNSNTTSKDISVNNAMNIPLTLAGSHSGHNTNTL